MQESTEVNYLYFGVSVVFMTYKFVSCELKLITNS